MLKGCSHGGLEDIPEPPREGVPLVLISGKDGAGIEPCYMTPSTVLSSFSLSYKQRICWLAFTTLCGCLFCVWNLYNSVTKKEGMEQMISIPVDLVLVHFKEVKVHRHNLSVKLRKGKMEISSPPTPFPTCTGLYHRRRSCTGIPGPGCRAQSPPHTLGRGAGTL